MGLTCVEDICVRVCSGLDLCVYVPVCVFVDVSTLQGGRGKI